MRKIENYEPRPLAEEEPRELLSVIVAVYNIEDYLERCVRSLMNQTWKNLQIILVDDGSTDGSGALCDTLAGEDPRILVVHKENGGLSDARNAGIERAEGRYLAFVDGDDWVDEDMYEHMLSALKEFDAPLCVCRYKQIQRNRIEDASTGAVWVFEGTEALECFLLEEDEVAIQNAAWNKLYTRELMGELRFPVGKYYEDIVYTTKLLARAGRTVYLDQAWYNYVLEREGSIMGEGIGERIFTDQIPAYEEKEAFLKSIGRADLADVHRYFFYKRLLLYYTALGKAAPEERRRFRGRIRQRLLRDREEMDRVYACRGAKTQEKRKMKIFLFSPRAYLWVIWVNDRYVVPMKQRIRRYGRRCEEE